MCAMLGFQFSILGWIVMEAVFCSRISLFIAKIKKIIKKMVKKKKWTRKLCLQWTIFYHSKFVVPHSLYQYFGRIMMFGWQTQKVNRQVDFVRKFDRETSERYYPHLKFFLPIKLIATQIANSSWVPLIDSLKRDGRQTTREN